MEHITDLIRINDERAVIGQTLVYDAVHGLLFLNGESIYPYLPSRAAAEKWAHEHKAFVAPAPHEQTSV